MVVYLWYRGWEKQTPTWTIILFGLFLVICRFRRPLLRPAIDRTDQVDLPRYFVCLLTPNRLGDRASTSQHVEPEQATPVPGPSAQACQVGSTAALRQKKKILVEWVFFETSSSELPLILFESETLFAVAKVSIRSQHRSHLMRL